MTPADRALHSGTLAHLSGVSPDTIRHYERIGILPKSPRTASGYRVYGREAVDRVQLVRKALQLGFTLAELAEIFQARDSGSVPCHRVLDLTEQKLRAIKQQIVELRKTQRYMQQLVRQWSLKLAHTKAGSKAMLLHDLTAEPGLRPTVRE
jgi:MerR family mercuric resistance operon transcriptional regulator/MerR family Zn(II)-responsive transcriptional regulator of zntA